MVAIGLLYCQGYFHQRLNQVGWQEDYYTDNEFDRLPLELMRHDHGDAITVALQVRSRMISVQT